MAGQKFSASEREAFWLAHAKKCAYTRELLDISSFHIDHIIPESLADNTGQLEALKTKLGLRNDFDLFGYENLLPCKPGANLQKSSLILESAHIHYFLGMAASKKPEIEKHLGQIEKRKNRGRALILLQQCLERGELTPDEVAQILEGHSGQPQEIFRLIEGMKFADSTEVQAVARDDIDELRSRPIKIGENGHIDGVFLENESHEEILVRTCKEYDTAIGAGFYARTNIDIKLSVYFKHQCGLLRALEIATTPGTSFIADPRVGVADLHLIPFSMFPQFGAEHEHGNSLATYQEKIDDGSLVVKRLRQNTLCIEEPEGMGQQLIEVARADFSGDGIEDILFFEYCYATHGTLGFGGIKILTRKSPENMFELITPCNL